MIFAMRRRTAARPRRRNPRPRLEVLEERSLLSVQLGPTWTGMSLSDSSINGEPPDPIVAAGMNNVVEMVNTDLAVYDKAGAKKFQVSMAKLFPSDAGLSFSDPQVTYDELKGQFFVGIIAYDLSSNPDQQASHFDYAILSESTISDLSSVEAAPKGSINTMESGPGGNLLADFPRVGWNADAYFVTFNMFYFSGSYDHVQLAIIPNSSGTTTQVDYDGGNFTVVPAIVHNDPDGSMWFIEEHGYDNGSQLQVVQMTDPSKPMGLGIYYVDVPAYGAPPAAPQPGGQGIDTGDTRMLSAAVRDGHLVATQNVGTNGTAHARWYDINLASGNAAANSMALYQSGEINPGNGIATYYPAIDINQNGDLGLAYMESSKREYMSMYITGRSHGDATPAGTMQAPREVMAGMGTYRGSRAGDYSGLSVDPSDNTTFWGASEYSLGGWSYWGTAVAGFTLTADTGGGGGGGGGGNGGGHGGGKPTKNAGTGLVGLAIPDLDLDEGDPLFIPGPFESGLVTDKKDRKG